MSNSNSDTQDRQNFRILIAEDDRDMLDLAAGVLREAGYNTSTAEDGLKAIKLLAREPFDLIVSDVKMPGADGMQVLAAARKLQHQPPVILITAFGSVESAVRAMKEGSYHYLAKPFRMNDLLKIVNLAMEQVAVQRNLSDPESLETSFFPVVFKSKVMQDLMRLLIRVADSEATIIIQGESGTGKELMATEIHRLSSRSLQQFIPLDCSSIPETLMESELFGHVKGSFTGAISDKKGLIEQAVGGSLFLDEISNIPLTVQAKLLRFLQERKVRPVGSPRETEVDVRIISASNRNLKEMVGEGSFRNDLYYRLAVIPITLPALRERKEDIAPLVYHFIRKYDKSSSISEISPAAIGMLVDYDWPGNVRELENVIERALVIRGEGMIGPQDLPDEITALVGSEERARESLDEIEKHHIEKMLAEYGGNQSQVARILGIDRRTLYRKIKKYGILM
jgi:DNA-binding NtrC family response regulator